MWTNENRTRYDRSKLRYPSDVTDAEWALVGPLIPPAKRGGGKRTVEMRAVVNGLMYVLSTGCQWRAIPKDLPPKSTVHGYFYLWTYDGTLDRIHHALYVKCREAAARSNASPRPSSTLQIKGKKRHILVDTIGLLLHALVHPADIQDRDGGVLVLRTMFGKFPFLQKLFADGGYQGPPFRDAQKKALPFVDTEIVKRSDAAKGFKVLPRRWVVERTFSWLGRCRRLAKDFENLNRKALAFLHLASIRLMLRRLCNQV
ncbi:IS5 family transposase [Methylosinus sp. LW3]|uniref:IS5 family transposase n=1 Tax=Methylosinus sp. LW3 TaxID=107635 RepID=UPI000464DA4E|nr:IS5 family transposase [Methylosinus sp. LW3]